MMFMLVAVFGVATFTSCSDDDDKGDKSHDSRLIGTWSTTEIDGKYTYILKITMKGDGSGIWLEDEYVNGNKVDTDNDKFTWATLNDQQLVLTFADYEDGKWDYEVETFTYVISGKTATIIDGDGDTWIMTKEK